MNFTERESEALRLPQRFLILGKSLFVAHPAISREKTQFLWMNDNLKMGKVVKNFFLSKKKKKEGRM